MTMVTSFAVMTISTNGAIPDGVSRMELFAKAAAMGEWEGSSGAASGHFFVMVLGHGIPLKTVVACVFNCSGYSYPACAHFLWSVVVGDEGAVIKVGMDT